jgi:hypothetical protein
VYETLLASAIALASDSVRQFETVVKCERAKITASLANNYLPGVYQMGDV